MSISVITALIGVLGFIPVSVEFPVSGLEERHCVVRVVDQKDDGQLVFDAPTCFARLSAALAFASDGLVNESDLAGVTGPGLFAAPDDNGALSSFTLGIHFDGYNGTGSSVSVVGSSCTGGWWNTGITWANRISSSWNGCYRLRHFDYPSKGGTWADTSGVGQTDNVPWSMNNRAESVAYYGS